MPREIYFEIKKHTLPLKHAKLMQYSRNENSLSCLGTLLYMYSVYTHLALSSYSAYVSMLRKTTSHAQDYMREHIVEDTCNVTDNPDIYIIGVTLLLLS